MKPDTGIFWVDHKVVHFFLDKVVLFLSYVILAFLVFDSFINLLPHGHGTVICFIGSNSVTSGQQSYINEYCADQVKLKVYLVPILVFGQGLLTILLHYSWYSMVLYCGNAKKKIRKKIEAEEMVAEAAIKLAEANKRSVAEDKKIAEADKILSEAKLTKSARARKKLAEADKRMAEADKRVAEAEKRMAEASKRKVEAGTEAANADINIAAADIKIVEADINIADADKRIAEADKQIAETDKKIAEMVPVVEADSTNLERDYETLKTANDKLAKADGNMVEADKKLAVANKVKVSVDIRREEMNKEMANELIILAGGTAQGVNDPTPNHTSTPNSKSNSKFNSKPNDTNYKLHVGYCIKNILQFVLAIVAFGMSLHYELNKGSYNIKKSFNCSTIETIAMDIWDHLDTVQCYYATIALNDVFIIFYGITSICVILITVVGIVSIFWRKDIKIIKNITTSCCSHDTAIIKHCLNESNADLAILMEDVEFCKKEGK